jgi:hypothetical protein
LDFKEKERTGKENQQPPKISENNSGFKSFLKHLTPASFYHKA